MVIACSRFNIRDGVRQLNTLTVRMENTGELTDAGMEKEDLGLMMSTFCEVGKSPTSAVNEEKSE